MLDSAIYYRRAFTHLQLTDSNYKHGLWNDEWDEIEGIYKFLRVFYCVTQLFSGSKYPTTNLYFPNVFLVEHTLIKAIKDRNFVARDLAVKLKPKFDKYWKDYSMILAIAIAVAVAFDPRYKMQFVEFSYKLLYENDCANIDQLRDTLKDFFNLCNDTILKQPIVAEDMPETSSQTQGSDVMKVLLEYFI